jgi:predicted RNase H-like nuclease (RuvC/YqgF family)
LTLANQSPSHISCLKQTISNQQQEIQRLSAIIENKTKEFFKLNQDNNKAQNKLENRLSKERQLNQKLRVRIRELEYLLASSNTSTPQLDSHNSNLSPSLDPPRI